MFIAALFKISPLTMGFFRQEYWKGLPCPSPGYLPNPEIKPGSPALRADSLPSEPQGGAHLRLDMEIACVRQWMTR